VVLVASTVWHALSIVHPPRAQVDSAQIARELPDSEAVSFRASDGLTLVGDFVQPRNGAAVVLVHGLFANREQLLPEAGVLAQHGYGVLIFDNRAHGDSGGDTATWGLLESDDAARAVEFVEARTQLPPEKIATIGFSIGGTAVLREAVGDSHIGAVVVEGTYSSMGGEIDYMFDRYGVLSEKTARLTAQLIGGLDYSQLVPEDLLCELRSRPLLLVYGSGDSDVPIAEGRRMAQVACAATSLLVVTTSTHGGFMAAADSNAYSRQLLTFLDSHLL
jgi:pimeloyl-ACP methyl ester carboxylesterase